MTNPLLSTPQLQTVPVTNTTDQTSLFTGIGMPTMTPWQQSQMPASQQQQSGIQFNPNYNWIGFSNILKGVMSAVTNARERRDQERYVAKQNNPLLTLPYNPNTSAQQQFGMDYYKEGGIHIKKENRGKFTEYCGGKVTDACIQKGKNSSSSTIRKRATFADNARHWKHEEGGDVGDPVAQPKGYKASTLQQRKDWNSFLDFLSSKNVQGSTELDKRDQSLWKNYFNEYRTANPNTTINEEFVPIAQYEGTLLRQGIEIPNVASRKVVDNFSKVLGDPWKNTISPIDSWVGSITSKMYYPRISESKTSPAFNEDYAGYDSYISGTAKMNCGGKVYKRFKPQMDEGGYTPDLERELEKEIEDSIFTQAATQQAAQEQEVTQNAVQDTYEYGDPIMPRSSLEETDLQPATYTPIGRNIPEIGSNEAIQAFKNGIAGSEGADYFGGTNIKGKDGKPISSAFGKYQFLKGTREQVRKQFFPNISQKDFEQTYKTSPEFQERVMDVYSGHLLNKFKDPERAALAFFMGEGADVNPLNRSYRPTPQNASVGQYLDRFNKGYKYELGGTYELDDNQIAILKSQGYKIQYI